MLRLILTALFSCLLLSSPLVLASEASVLFVHGSHSNKAKLSLMQEMAPARGLRLERMAQSDLKDVAQAAAVFSAYDLVVLESASAREGKQIFSQYADLPKNLSAKILPINWLEAAQLRRGLSEQQALRLHQYYDNGGRENLSRMLAYLQADIFGLSSDAVPEPIIYPEIGIYHPDATQAIFSSLEDYLSWRQAEELPVPGENKAVVGVLMQRALIESVQTQVVDDAIARLEKKGIVAVPFFFQLSPVVGDYSYIVEQNGKPVIDLILNFRSIHWASKRQEEFADLGVPVLQTLNYSDGDQQHWEQSNQGISPTMTPFVLTLPESAGVIDPWMVSATDEKTGGAQVIDYQMEHLINKAEAMLALKHKPNAEKRLTTMIWGDRDVGASFLNVPDSLRSISERLNQEGYRVDEVANDAFTDAVGRILNPFYRDYQLDELLKDDLAELMPLSEYLAWFNTLPESVRQPINEYWGDPKDNFMVVEQGGQLQFVLPRIRSGNMLIMRQPPRADDRDEDKRIYHSGAVPVNHFYLAAYYYAREYWGSDAIIHLGTHGSQEWLGGKERGLSIYDHSNLAVWDTPVFYPFIVDDVGEAMQTKRRGRATVLAHMTPPFAAAGLQGDIADLHELIHQYKSLGDGGVKAKTGQQIIDDCIATHVCKDFGWDDAQIAADFDGFLYELHDYIETLASENQPLGLHSYGELPEEALLISTLVQMLGSDFSSAATEFEMAYFSDDERAAARYQQAQERGEHFGGYNELLHNSGEELEDIPGYKTVKKYILEADTLTDKEREAPNKALVEWLDKAQELYQNYTGIKELDHLVDGLQGRYIPVKNGGDPIRHPDAVPTGFNLYGFDPARLPTKAAYAQGKELTEGVIADYYAKHGRYPDKLAFSLWSIEAMRHYGVLESQALYAMGVRPVWSEDGRVIGTEIIPANELKRPRVDVVLSATGLYRDAFPNVMQMLAKAVEKVIALQEESNFVWRNSVKVRDQLIAEGVAADEAEYLSTVRLFSSASGSYGAGVEDAVVASDTWESDSKISDLYLSKMGYFYGSDNSRWGQQLEYIDLYAKQLSGTDVALFSRSSNVYGMLASDDPFEYFGSLAMAVRNLDGASPEMVISNLRDADNPKAQAAAKFLATELRSRNFHKRWIQEMQKEGYSGAVSLASHLTNFWGWQVVDPNLVRDDQWQEFFEVYVNDKLELGINEWFEEVNPRSQAEMLERMLESVRKDYWEADEQTLAKMVERYVDLVTRFDIYADNEKLREFVDQQAAGFGLLPLPALTEAPIMSGGEMVQGQKLEKVEQPPAEQQDSEAQRQLMMAFGLCLLALLLGGARQWFDPQFAGWRGRAI